MPSGFEKHRRGTKSSNRKFLAAGVIMGLAALTLVFVAMQGSAVYYVTVKEFNARQAILVESGKELRVAGKVVPGTIARDNRGALAFTAMDKEDPSQSIKVSYANMPPDTFKDEAEVVVTGTFANGVFTASEMLAKCPSKYSSQAGTE